jgi:hypothetical protein
MESRCARCSPSLSRRMVPGPHRGGEPRVFVAPTAFRRGRAAIKEADRTQHRADEKDLTGGLA